MPEHVGFGSRLISQGITYELGGEVSLDYAVTGVTCTIAVPIPGTGKDDESVPADG